MDARHLFDGMLPQKRPKNEEEPPAASAADRISDLPEGVLHHVLSLMPAHDAVRTCVLARRWRHLWRSAPAIRITGFKGFGSADRFNQFVDRLLLHRRRGAPLESCEFFLVESDFDFDQYLDANEPHLRSWIQRALCCQVRVLRVDVREFDDLFYLHERPLFSQHLTRLELECVFTNDRVLDFSGCPTLLDLKMENCTISADKMSSSSLKHLRMFDCQFYDRTRMFLPNLVSLELDDCLGRTPLLESMPSLVTAIVRLGCGSSDRCDEGGSGDCGDDTCEGCPYYYDDDRRSCMFLEGLLQATDLELSADPDVLVFKRDLKWCPAFSKLKTLVLDKWCVAADFSALIWFLQHSPILEKLTLQLLWVHKISAGIEGSYNPLEQSVTSNHLEVVEIKCQEVDGMVLKILKILNASGIPLEKINIHYTDRRSCFGCSSYVWTCTQSCEDLPLLTKDFGGVHGCRPLITLKRTVEYMFPFVMLLFSQLGSHISSICRNEPRNSVAPLVRACFARLAFVLAGTLRKTTHIRMNERWNAVAHWDLGVLENAVKR